jgi:phage terminase small subunit
MSSAKLATISKLLPPAKLPAPPKHLSREAKRWFIEVTREFDLSPTDLKLLCLAGECLDLAETARRSVAKDGATIPDEKGVLRANPAVLIARDNRTLFARLIRDLRIDGAPQIPAAKANGRPGGSARF